jgi:symplekin
MGEFQIADGMIRDFALQLLRRLQTPRPVEKSLGRDAATAAGIDNMEDGQLPPEDLLQTPYLPERMELPAQKLQVVQHVELLFALSSKAPDFLDEYVLLCSSAPPVEFLIAVPGSSPPTVKWMSAFRRRFKT